MLPIDAATTIAFGTLSAILAIIAIFVTARVAVRRSRPRMVYELEDGHHR